MLVVLLVVLLVVVVVLLVTTSCGSMRKVYSDLFFNVHRRAWSSSSRASTYDHVVPEDELGMCCAVLCCAVLCALTKNEKLITWSNIAKLPTRE